MNERVIFDAALQIADPLARRAFVEKACAGNPEMLAAVESLLKSHDAAGSFLDIPAAAQVKASVSANPEDSAAADEKTRRYQPGAIEDSDDDADASQPDLSFLKPSSKPGSIGVLAHYEVLSVLGQGAFGIVFKAFDEKLHRLVAIKVMNPQMASTSPPRKRFLREARSAAAIKHENIVQVYSVEEQPLPYLVMEFIDGQTLKEKLDGVGPLETPEVLHIARQIASGLSAAQTMGLIHRDIKPANILLEQGAEQRVKISDFGLARAADDASMTRTGVISGTPMYMAPEQATGQALDHRADLFSLGSVLYQMACGRPPFRAATTVAVLRRVVEDTPRPLQEILSEIPDWLVAIVTKLLAKKPEDRFQTAKEVTDLLASCQSELQTTGKVTCVPIQHDERSRHAPRDEPDAPSTPNSKPTLPNATQSSTRSTPEESSTSTPRSAHHAERDGYVDGKRSNVSRWLIAVAVIGIAVLAGIIFNHKYNDGLVTEIKVPSGSKVAITESSSSPHPSSWHGWSADAPPPAIAPFDAEQAKQHQAAWAKYLGVPVEHTNSIGMKFRLIPPGEFLMGSTPTEIEAALKALRDLKGEDQIWQRCIESEAPQHKVILTKPMYVGVHEVTQGQYEQMMGTNPSGFAPMGVRKDDVAGIVTTNHPVEMVSWNDAVDFCVKLSHQEKLKPTYFQAGETVTLLDGTGYRLPTEAEWEYTCRAGTTTLYWFGDKDEDLSGACWYGKNSGGRTHSVGELKSNPFGLFDIHGNAWEWVQDAWESTYYRQFQEKPALDPHGPESAEALRVVRGGIWQRPHASYCRAAFRDSHVQNSPDVSLGFRAALSVEAVRQALKVDGPKTAKPGVPVGANGKPVAEQGRSAWDDLDPAQIPEAERVPRQPEGLVAVLGQHRRRGWSTPHSSSVSPDGTQFTLTTDDGLYLFGHDPKQPGRFFNFGIMHPSATFLPDGRIAAFVCDGVWSGHQLQIFAKPRGGEPLEKETATIANHNTEAISHATASSDGHWLAAFDYPASIGLWRLGDAPPQRAAKFVLRAIDGNIPPFSFSPDAHWFCFTDTSQGQGTIHLIDLQGDTPREAAVLKADADEKSDAPAKGFQHAAFLSDGRLATADRNGRTWFWKINDGDPQRVGSIPETGLLHSATKSLRLAILGGRYGVWDLSVDPPRLLGTCASSFAQDNIQCAEITPNGETVFTGHLNGAVRFWNVSQSGVTELDSLIPNPRNTHYGRTKVADRLLCAAQESSRLGIWRPTRDGLQTVSIESPAFLVLDASPTRRQFIVRESLNGGGTALLRYDADRVTPTRRITGDNNTSAALNDEGHRLAIGRDNGTEEVLELWGWESDDLPARKLFDVKSPLDDFTQLAFAEAGRALVGRRYGGSIEIWDVKGDQLVPRATLPPHTFLQFAVAPDGQTLATCGNSSAGSLELWNLKSDLTKPTAGFAIPWATAVAFSPDGRRLAVSYWENGASAGVQIINLASGVVEKRLTFPGRVHELTFTDDNRHLITGNANATIYVVRLNAAPK